MRQSKPPPRPPFKQNHQAKTWLQRLARQPWRRIVVGLLLVAGLGLILTGIDWSRNRSSVLEPGAAGIASGPTRTLVLPPSSRPITSTSQAQPVAAARPPAVAAHTTGAVAPGLDEPVPATIYLAAATVSFDPATDFSAGESPDRPLSAAVRDNLDTWYRPGRSELDRLVAELDSFIDVFEPGDPPSRVMVVQGFPDEATPTTWRYGSSLVCFKDGHVARWYDGFPRLRIRLREEIPFTDWKAVLGR
jgi:hypothetical protein